MSKIDNTANSGQSNNSSIFPAPTKLSRTNPSGKSSRTNIVNYTSQIIIEDENKFQLPNKVSALDQNVLFQDMDNNNKKTKDFSTKEVSNSNLNSSNDNGVKAIGLISNIFLGSTNKFVKGGVNSSTPTKTIEQIQEQIPEAIKVTPIGKLARTKEINQAKTRTISGKDQQNEVNPLDTDRSQTEIGKKIERKQGGNRQLAFVEKKEQKIEIIQQKVKQVKIQSEIKPQQVQDNFQRVYQPQRSNPYNKSRILTQVVRQPQPIKQQLKQASINQSSHSKTKSILINSKVSESEGIKPSPNRQPNKKIGLDTPQNNKQNQQQSNIKPQTRSFVAKQIQKTNSTLSFNPRNSSIITKQTQAKNEQKSKIQQHDKLNISLKKSISITYIIKRLITYQIRQSFAYIRQFNKNIKIKNNNQCLIVTYSINSIIKNKQSNLLKLGFQSIKKKFINPYISSLKSSSEITLVNYKNTGINLIQKIFTSKIRQSFKKIKFSWQKLKNIQKCINSIDSLSRKKISKYLKLSFQLINLKAKSKYYFINQLSNIQLKVNQNKVSAAFYKIVMTNLVSLKVEQKVSPQKTRITSKIEQPSSTPNNQALINKLQKLKAAIPTLNNQISSAQNNVQKNKKAAQNQKSSLNEKITLLNLQNEQVTNQNQIKKHRNDQIKKQLQTIAPKNLKLEQDLPQSRQSKLELLTNIYISNFKNADQIVQANQIANNYNLSAQDAVIFSEWESILKNIELKRIIAAYQGVQCRESSGRANLLGEQALAAKLIRSYIKEQYFWNWIHLSAQNI